MLNSLGYNLLRGGNNTQAIEVFKLVTGMYLNSSNTHDNLGEAYAKNGDKKHTITSYAQSPKLDSKNRNAVKALRKLRGK